MRNYTVAKSDGAFVVKDFFGFVIRKPGGEDKALSEQIPLYFTTEKAALEAAKKFQAAEEKKSEDEANVTSQHSKDRLARMDAESARLRRAAEERSNLASSTAKVRELTSEIVTTEHEIRMAEATISSLEGKLEAGRIDLRILQTKIEALKDALAKAKKGEPQCQN